MFYLETHYRRKQPQKLDTVADYSIGQEGRKQSFHTSIPINSIKCLPMHLKTWHKQTVKISYAHSYTQTLL